jgi:spore coat polysaccharide biosynthesis protein SpsF (cytidylyltransferase family)
LTIVVVVQARMGSSRLPGKVLADLGGRPVLAHVLQRASQIDGIDQTVLAIPAGPEDDVLEDVGRRASVTVVRGDAADVLNRYHAAAHATGAGAIVRVTADCPLLDPRVSSDVVNRFRIGDVDYVSNIHPPTYPDGYDTEIMSAAALDAAWREAADPYEREHVTPFIWRRPDRFRLANVAAAENRSSWRLTLDTESDLAALRRLWARLADVPGFGIADVASVAAREPDLIPGAA